MNACVLLLGVIEWAGKLALRIGFTTALLLVIPAGDLLYRRCAQWFGWDPEVIMIIWSGLLVVVVVLLCQLWFG